jgi:hypothetical protein
VITAIIYLVAVGLLLYLVYLLLGKFLPGDVTQIVGIILGLVFLLYALRTFNIL